MSLRLEAVSFDVPDPTVAGEFWARLLGRHATPEAGGVLVPGGPTQVGLRFVSSPAPRHEANRLHLHVTTSGDAGLARTVESALALGAVHCDVGQRPDEDHVVLADPAGDPFCVIPPYNRFLAGCGPLGEVACDGTREVGLFWRDALGWPLVWEEGQETAVQSPAGGTKVSWGGPPVAPRTELRNRQRFHLVADDVAGEVARLVLLGATARGDLDGGVELVDPDGNEFVVRAA